MTNSYTTLQVNISKGCREKSGKLNFKRAITPVKVRRDETQIHVPNFKSISQRTAEKSPENFILAKGNNSCKKRSSVRKLKLDLYYVTTHSYTKFQVNISKDWRENSGKGNSSSKYRYIRRNYRTMVISLVSVKPNCRHSVGISVTSFGQKYAFYTMFADMMMIIQHVETFERRKLTFSCIITGHNQYDGKKRDRENSQDKKEKKTDAFSRIFFKFSFRTFYDYKHSIPWGTRTRNLNQYLSCVLPFNRENDLTYTHSPDNRR